MNRLKSVILAGVLTLAVSVNTGCGKPEISVWETEHECGTWEVDSFDELILDNRLPLEEVAKEIPDFCYFKERPEGFQGHRDWDYMASVPVSIKGSSYDFHIYLYFNADKEFIGWGNSFVRGPDEAGEEFINEWNEVIEDSLGESEGKKYSDKLYADSWSIGDSLLFLEADLGDEFAKGFDDEKVAAVFAAMNILYSIEYYPR